jgi:type IV secretory pathway TraG/TraD family ATPase VirD4
VSGLQTIAQLRDTYGHDEAQTLLSCLSTKLVMAAGDGETPSISRMTWACRKSSAKR